LLEQWNRAVENYRVGSTLKKIPQHNRALLFQNMGTALFHLKRYDDAIEAEHSALDNFPELMAPHLIVAVIAVERRNFDLAIWELQCYLEKAAEQAHSRRNYLLYHEPNHSFIYTLLGRAYYHSKNFQAAMSAFQNALKDNSLIIEPYYWIGKTYCAMNNYTQACNIYKKAIAIDPKNSGLFISLGEVEMGAQEFSKAEKSFRDALELDESNEYALKMLGQVLFFQEKYQEAVKILERGSSEDDSVEYKKLLAEVYVRTENQPQAEKVLQSLITEDYRHAEIYLGLAKIAESRGETRKALDMYSRVIECNEGSAETYFLCGNKCMQSREYTLAERAFKLSVQKNPLVKEPHFNLAITYIKLQDFEKAAQSLHNILKIDPLDRAVKRTLAGVYAKLGNSAMAEKYLLESKE